MVALAAIAAHAPAAEGPAELSERVFAPRTAPRGTTLFALVPSATSGIEATNDYTDPEMWNKRYLEFTVGGLGTGVAIGDYDNDGRADVFIVSKTETCRLFRNLGDWKFEDVTSRARLPGASDGWAAGLKRRVGLGDSVQDTVSAWKQGASFVDVNNDGWLDLYVCRFGAPNWLFVNQGDGTFREEAAARGLAVTDASSMAAFHDYDRDGWLDVYLQTNLLDAARSPNGQPDYLFRNNGDGTFTDVTQRAGIAGITQGHSATWWDYNQDGWPDLQVANDFAPPDQLYRNNGDGTFTNVIDAVVPHTTHSSMGADLGDVNNDGLIDLFVADMAATTYEKDQRTMAGERERSGEDPGRPTVAPQDLRNVLFLNTGRDRMQEAAALHGLAATDWTWATRLEDLDHDGRLDLYVTNGMIREETNTDLMTRMMVAENPAERIRVLRQSPALAERNLAYRNLGDHTFAEIGAEWGLDQLGVSLGAALGDLDGDGDLDLVFTNYLAGPTVLRNDQDAGHSAIISLRGTRSNRFGIGATVRLVSARGAQVRPLVLARGYLSSSEPIAHFGLGDDPRIHELTVTWPSGVVQTFKDLDVGRHFTITEPASPAPALSPPRLAVPATGASRFVEVTGAANLSLTSREEVVDETAQQTLLPLRHNRRGPALAIGDFTGDGHDDIVVGGTTLDAVRLVTAAQAGKFAAAGPILPDAVATLNDGPLLAFDANGDGRNEILLTRGGAKLPEGLPEYQPQLLVSAGRGFAPAGPGTLPALPSSLGAAVSADVDRDGRLDLFLGARLRPGDYPMTPRSALWFNRGGRFEDVTDAIAPALRNVGMVTAALWSDFDGDGWTDLLVTLDWGLVRCFRNDRGRAFIDRTREAGFAAAGTGWWNSLAAADYNGDGRPDYAVGNLGLNTPYQASPERPALLFYGDIGGNGVPQIIEARWNGDRLGPWRSRRMLAGLNRSIARRFPRNDDYARATLEEIVGAETLAAAQRFAATEFRSGVFLSQPDGTFRFAPLPRIAQIAPIHGLAAGDFDGDGHADLYAVQNSHAPIPVIGRFDGGLSQLLRGDGRGGFTAVPPVESGLVVPGDARALAVLDFDRDGWPDFVVSRNNSSLLAFRNQPRPGGNSFRVRLRGPTGNPTAVGARITVELADGSTQTSEVYAGSGYSSQSSAACFFGHPDGNPPRNIRVRWPSGATTSLAVTAPVGPSVEMAAPAP